MLSVIPTHVGPVRAACLFAQNKYRLISALARRFNDQDILSNSEASESLYQRLSLQLPLSW
jgi:hypothetical protein